MDILERYLQAIAEHLPAGTRQDTIAELRANLLAEIESREEQLNRPLTEDEAAKILEAHGMPLMVAARYRPQYSLISPAMFPLYWHTLKKSFPLLVLAYVVIVAVQIFLQGQPLSTLPAALLHFWSVALTFWAIVTLGFAIFDYLQRTHVTKFDTANWSIRDLPKVQAKEKLPSLVHDVADVIVSIAAILWLLAVPTHPYLMFGPGLKYAHNMPFALTPAWHTIYWQFMALITAMLPFKIVMLFPRIRPQRAWLQLCVQALGIMTLTILIHAKTLFVPAPGTTQTLQSLVPINSGIVLGLKIALLISAIKLAWDLWQLIRTRTGAPTSYAAVW